MTEPVVVDTEGMTKSSGSLDTLASYLGDLFNTLMGRLLAEGQCWGTCEIGTGFAEQYLPTAKQLMEIPPNVVQVLTSSRARLNSLTKGYEVTDQVAGDLADQVNKHITDGTNAAPAPGAPDNRW